jgi:23S rRNA (uracil1939-C5)-methyltransferase
MDLTIFSIYEKEIGIQKLLLYNVIGGFKMKLEIEKLDHFGRGIGYLDGKITFVYNALPNEEVIIEIIEENKNYNVAKVLEYLKKSPKRVLAFCPFYNSCGGCNLEHLSYLDTLEFKCEKVENILTHANLDIPKINVIANEKSLNYRNKLSLKIVNGRLGFYETNSHELEEITECLLAATPINNLLKQVKKLKIKNGLITIRANYNDEVLMIIDTEDKINFKIDDFENVKIVGVILNEKVIYGNSFFYERIHNHLFKVSYDAFFQVNPYITNKLFEILEENLEDSNKVLDLYSGVGTLGIIASKKAKEVCSIEIIKNAVLDNMENIKLNHTNNISVHLGDAKKVLEKINTKFDTIIIDPPRKGLDKKSLNIILNNKATKIIYISCNPITLARDLQELTKEYEISKLYVLDMFSFTYHCETFCILERK